ncbi:MAG: hypothetical protein ABI702_06545 [Burkholderiales bacterium]
MDTSLRMPASKFRLSLWTIVYQISALCAILASGRVLPPTVASHFGADGLADGYMNRNSYLAVAALVGVVLPMVISAVTAIVARPSKDISNMRAYEASKAIAIVLTTVMCAAHVFVLFKNVPL